MTVRNSEKSRNKTSIVLSIDDIDFMFPALLLFFNPQYHQEFDQEINDLCDIQIRYKRTN